MKRNNICIRVKYDPPPIPGRDCDWQGYIEGEEETTSRTGPTPENVLLQIVEHLLDEQE